METNDKLGQALRGKVNQCRWEPMSRLRHPLAQLRLQFGRVGFHTTIASKCSLWNVVALLSSNPRRIRSKRSASSRRLPYFRRFRMRVVPCRSITGFGDVIYPTATMIDYPTMLDFETPRMKGYPKETVIAEKFEAMVKHGQLNSRMKDFYDIHVLLCQFGFDGEILRLAMERTFANRGTVFDSELFVFSPPFLADSVKQTQWTAFVRKSKLTNTSDSVADVVREFQAFLPPLVQAVHVKQSLISRWVSGGPRSSHPS